MYVKGRVTGNWEIISAGAPRTKRKEINKKRKRKKEERKAMLILVIKRFFQNKLTNVFVLTLKKKYLKATFLIT